jgi:small subunit ribosomal protein S1
VKLLDVDVEKERISLGIKQLTAEPVVAATVSPATPGYRKGEVVTCSVTAVQDSGIEVALADGLIAFIRRSDLSRERTEQRADRFAVGEKVDAKITSFDPKTRKVGLSIKAREVEEDKKALAEYGSSDSGASLGDILGAALSRAEKARGKAKGEAKDETSGGEEA